MNKRVLSWGEILNCYTCDSNVRIPSIRMLEQTIEHRSESFKIQLRKKYLSILVVQNNLEHKHCNDIWWDCSNSKEIGYDFRIGTLFVAVKMFKINYGKNVTFSISQSEMKLVVEKKRKYRMFLFNPDCEDAISIIVLNNLFEYFSNIDYIFDKSKISGVRVLSKEMEIEVNLDEFSDYEIIPIQVDEKIKRLMSVFTNGN